jgi:hypothetical protein
VTPHATNIAPTSPITMSNGKQGQSMAKNPTINGTNIDAIMSNKGENKRSKKPPTKITPTIFI